VPTLASGSSGRRVDAVRCTHRILRSFVDVELDRCRIDEAIGPLTTLEAIFAKPTSGTLEWARIEALFMAVGCQVVEGRGSRVRLVHGERFATFQRPHPAKEAKADQVEQVRAFLGLIGVTP
jgi:hypothetical protein